MSLIDVNDIYSLFDKSGFARLHVADIDTIPRVDAVEVVRCRDCIIHGDCYVEDAFLFAGVPNPFCVAGKLMMPLTEPPKEVAENETL